MPVSVLIGTQWGDEGKGKLVDVLAAESDLVVRFNGGANAGHTVSVGEEVYKLHLLPSAILHSKTRSLLASGVALDPETIVKEIQDLEERGIRVTPKQLGIDYRCSIVLPWHKLADAAKEAQAAEKIGTTGRGIGPCYADQASRIGLRLEDFLDSERLRRRVHDAHAFYHLLLEKAYRTPLAEKDKEWEVVRQLEAFSKKLVPYACDVSTEIHQAIQKDKRILFEGAQGTFLDNRFGTYPFVTSTGTLASHAASSAGIPARSLEKVEGVIKAYTTRVGNGPFPTEISGELADQLREQGGEYGTTTGRPRRVGWLDLPLLKYAVRVNGLHGFHLTKLDVLSGLPEIHVATHYTVKGKRIPEFPANMADLEHAKPVYEKHPGFELPQALSGKGVSSLPKDAQNYVRYIEKELGIPALSISYGPKRDQTLFR
ncbi:adenylosuccinate synthase [Candidatus Micrarchaeota archaeon]|nr:adenylosuccinate synthase [Candidatus Micrarchaeota archaeon]